MSPSAATLMAVSIAGHDKGRLYKVIEEDDRWCVLVNGKNRPLDKPKRKKKMHLMKIRHVDSVFAEKLIRADEDSEIYRLLSEYAQMKSGSMKV